MPKIVDHEKYRIDLLERSFECFTQKGYSQLTMRDLAQHLGVSTGTLYHYFPSKEAIFEQLVEFQADQDLVLAASLGVHKSLELSLEAVLKLMVEHQDYLLKQASLWLDFGRQNGFESLAANEAIVRSYRRYRTWLAEFLQSNDQDLVTFVCGYLSGLVMDMSFHPGRLSIKAQAAMLVGAIKSKQAAS